MPQSRLSLGDVNKMVQNLSAFYLRDVGSQKWNDQLQRLQDVNGYLHAYEYSSMMNKTSTRLDMSMPDYIDVFTTKMDIIVQNLVCFDTWRDVVFKSVKSRLVPQQWIAMYVLFFSEGTLTNILELLLYHKRLAEAISDDLLLELADYCVRKLGRLVDMPSDWPPDVCEQAGLPVTTNASASPMSKIYDRISMIEYQTAISSIHILHYLVTHLEPVSVGLLRRLLVDHEIVDTMVSLIERPPWTKNINNTLIKYVDGGWMVVARQLSNKITKTEGMLWVTLLFLMQSVEGRKMYQLTLRRQQLLMKLKPLLSDVLVDQVPPLSNMQRLLSTISLMQPSATSSAPSMLIHEVPELRGTLEHEATTPGFIDNIMRNNFAVDVEQMMKVMTMQQKR